MKQGTLIRKIIYSVVFFSFFFAGSAAKTEAEMSDYCVTPPFIVGGVKPNLLMLFDNSSSMYDLNYLASTLYSPTTFSCTGTITSTPTSYCMDDTFIDSKVCSLNVTTCSANSDCPQTPVTETCTNGICAMATTSCTTDANCPLNASCANPYVGYFDTTKWYQYQTATYNAVTPAASDYFAEVSSASVPSTCSFKKSYVCVDYSGTAPNNVSAFYARGDFLNWLTASKLDIEKKILTGGKYAGNLLTGESRGCVGRRFIKLLRSSTYTAASPVYENITFAVRGPNATDPDNVMQGVDGGLTRIEVFSTVNTNMDDCQCAVAQWTSGQYGSAKTSTDSCLNVVNTELNAYNQIMQDCWTIKQNLAADSRYPFGSAGNTPSINSTKTQCLNVYKDLCGSESGGKCSKRGLPPGNDISASIINSAAGNYQCTSAGTHITPTAPYNMFDDNLPFPGSATDPGVADTIPGLGFIGKCVTSWSFTGNQLSVTWEDSCVQREILHFCYGTAVAEVTDPTEGSASTGGNIPSVLMDSSIRSFGDPKATMYSRLYTATTPTGLLKTFGDQIRFGAMAFYSGAGNNGAKSECGVSGSNIACTGHCSTSTTMICSADVQCPSGQTCVLETKTDGGQVISYINDSVGDHTSGLIKIIDDLQAKAWTPFSEMFYSAIGYYAKDSSETYPVAAPATGNSRDFNLTGQTNYATNQNPSQWRCQRNNILLISDGASTADTATAPKGVVDLYRPASTYQTGYDTTNSCPKFSGSRSLDDLAWIAKNRNIRTFSTSSASTTAPASASEYIDTYVVYGGTMTVDASLGQCNPKTLMDDTASAGGTSAALKATNPIQLEVQLREAFQKIATKTASGTAASVLASGEGSGANLIQALFYPRHRYNNTDISWTGVLQNLWYYIDPFLGKSSIRADTTQDKVLGLNSDYILQFSFAQNETKANLYADANGDGSIDSLTTPPTPTVSDVAFSNIKYLWESGKSLFLRSPGSLNTDAGARKIFTNLNDDITIDNFDTTSGNVALLRPLVNVNVNVADDANHTQTQRLIRYIRGMDDVSGATEAGADSDNNAINDDPNDTIDAMVVRNRTVTIDGATHTWKLGDIVNATPKIVSWVPLNLYDKVYRDTTYASFTQTTGSTGYKNRGMVFSGANDGMLHAFKLGLLGIYNDQYSKASIGKYCSSDATKACRTSADCASGTCDTDTDIGKEEWAFIPKNALPYLKYLADPTYCHLYYIDATPYILDASINKVTDTDDDGTAAGDTAQPASCTNTDYWTCDKYKKSWRTVLIGGMRLGGACRNSTSNCRDCTKTPIDGTGYSTYFALDITNPSSPTLLWEISNPALGYALSGPAIVRIGDKNKNGRWYAIFGSGPSGYVTPDHQFLGITEHNNYSYSSPYTDTNPSGERGDLRLFVYDLRNGTHLKTINAKDTYNDLYAAFAGNMVNGAIDFDQDNTSSTGFYQDDAVYFGYTSRSALGGTLSAQGGTGNTIRLASTSDSAAGFYTGKFVHRYDGGHQTKLITAYSGSGGTPSYQATVDSNWNLTDGNPVSGTQYNILDGWTDGGVMRLLTKQNQDPTQWVVSRVIANTGPVVAAVAKLQNFKQKNLRLFFGSGRYFFKTGEVLDDANSDRKLYGVVEPCITSSWINTNAACSTTVTGALGNASTAAGDTDADGWYIALDSSSGAYGAERVTTDPLAITTGAVFFTTSSPTADVCEYGGQSHLWAVKYDTGGSLAGTGVLKGKAIVQVSTGSIEEVDLDTAFTQGTDIQNRQGRRSYPMQGLPPSGGLSIIVPPKPINKILHMKKQ